MSPRQHGAEHHVNHRVLAPHDLCYFFVNVLDVFVHDLLLLQVEPFHIFLENFAFLHVLLENRIRIGKISSLPASISKIRTILEKPEKTE